MPEEKPLTSRAQDLGLAGGEGSDGWGPRACRGHVSALPSPGNNGGSDLPGSPLPHGVAVRQGAEATP